MIVIVIRIVYQNNIKTLKLVQEKGYNKKFNFVFYLDIYKKLSYICVIFQKTLKQAWKVGIKKT